MGVKSPSEKITFSLPKPLAQRFKAQVPARQRSELIAQILEEYLAIEEQQLALAESAGCWSDDRHPELQTEADVDNWLVALRSGWQREKLS